MNLSPATHWLTAIARPEIQGLRAYEHATWEPGLTRLHANELPWRTPVDASQAGLNRYPEPHPHELTAALAQHYGVPPAQLLAGRGSDELIDLLLRSYCRAGVDAIVHCPPTFGMYAVAAHIQGARVLDVPLVRAQGYTVDSARILAAIDAHSVKLVFLCSPNNPTGNLVAAATVLDLAARLAGRALLVLDEAYIDFADTPSLIPQIALHPGLVVLRTLSKAYGLAGCRCGVMLAHADIVALLRRVIQPYAITQSSIETVFAALSPAALVTMRRQVALLKDQRRYMVEQLAALPCVAQVWPSDANFLLVEFRDAAAALARAHAVGILLRDMRRAPGLEAALRITIGAPEENQRLLAALKELR